MAHEWVGETAGRVHDETVGRMADEWGVVAAYGVLGAGAVVCAACTAFLLGRCSRSRRRRAKKCAVGCGTEGAETRAARFTF